MAGVDSRRKMSRVECRFRDFSCHGRNCFEDLPSALGQACSRHTRNDTRGQEERVQVVPLLRYISADC
jgi:hypothetical protein